MDSAATGRCGAATSGGAAEPPIAIDSASHRRNLRIANVVFETPGLVSGDPRFATALGSGPGIGLNARRRRSLELSPPICQQLDIQPGPVGVLA